MTISCSRRQRPSGSTISFVTATVLVVLDEARKAGIRVPQKIVDRGMASLVRQRKPDFSYDYGEYLKYHPMMPINRPGGSLGRSQACNLAMRAWGDKQVTDTVVETWLDRLFARELWLDLGRKRPIPHESWFQVAGYFFYYGHYYASRCIEILPPAERPPRQDQLARDPLGLAGAGRKLVGFSLVRLPPAVWDGLRADELGQVQAQVSGEHQMVLLASGVKKAVSGSGTGCMRRKREDELSIVEPRNSMLCGIELVDVIDEQILRGEFFQINNQRPGGAVQVTFEVEERPTQRVDEFAGERGDNPSANAAQALYTRQASHPMSCGGPRWNRG